MFKHTPLKRAGHLPLLLASLVLAACGGGTESADTSDTSSVVTAATPTEHAAAADQNLLSLVNPFVGTQIGNHNPEVQDTGGAIGNTFPGATLPFNMVQFSPDTGYGEKYAYGGYNYDKNTLQGFSLLHGSGTGCSVFQNVSMLPIVGTVGDSPATHLDRYQTTFSHANEQASPGYYRVGLNNGIGAELTVTQRSGYGRFSYPTNKDATMIFNVGRNGVDPYETQLQIVGNDAVQGYVKARGVCGLGTYYVYFYGQFDRQFAGFGTYEGNTVRPNNRDALKSKNNGGWVRFANGGNVRLRIGVSYVSTGNAKLNMQTENPNWDFDGIKARAQSTWNTALNKVQIGGGSTEDRTKFYSALYHTMMHPNIFSDVNGQYIGFDLKTHTANGWTKYATFSGWDIYRSQVQLLGWLAPKEASDMAQSLVADAQAGGGGFPKWGTANDDSCVMTGDPGAVIVSSIHAFGGKNFDTGAALQLMDRATGTPGVRSRQCETRPGVADYVNRGYIPLGASNVWGVVATELEYAIADSAVAHFAAALGDNGKRDTYLSRAQRWKNVYSNFSGYMHPREANGSFKNGFSPAHADGFVEGSSAQYTWMVPQNYRGLFDRMGGNVAAIARLDEHFTQLDAGPNSKYAFMGDEPGHGTPWAYAFAGAPYKTQAVVRRIQNELYKNGPNGLTGNDDLGASSAWYVWSALGLYPEIPGVGGFVIGSPVFPDAAIRMGNGRTLRIHANNAGAGGTYIHSMSINGQPNGRSWLPLTALTNDTNIDFTLGNTPNTVWASAASDVPPSFEAPRVTQDSSSFTADFEGGAYQPDWNDTVDSQANVIGFCCAVNHMETSTRRENVAHSGSTSLMYSGTDKDTTRSFSYNKVLDVHVPVKSSTTLSYWIHPQGSASNSSYVAVDLIFTDGSTLRDSGATDQNGVRVHPEFQGRGNRLRSDAWNEVRSNIGRWAAGKTIAHVLVAYDRPDATGNFHGYIDDISITP